MKDKKILVVDDVKDWRDQLRSILKRSGYTVDTAKNYSEALEKIKYGQAELVIVDLRLDPVDENNRDGMKLLEILEKKRINALVLSGYGTSSLMEQAKLMQAVGFLKKNISLNKLKEVVKVIFAEIKKRDLNRAVETRKFYRGEIVGYPPEAAGYPLQESLTQKIEQLVK
ncbi:MAG TPA: response regulator [Chloroflexi bacterium]|nr:response regulator [Chloroflexota bacterium]